MVRRIFVTSDLHFSHHNIIKYCDRPFSSVLEMNDTLVESWNSVVKENDVVIIIGDYVLGNRTAVEEVTAKLKGYKILVKGNHDRCSNTAYRNAGIKKVFKTLLLDTSDLGLPFLNQLIINHFPTESNGASLVLHGHIHSKDNYGTLDMVDIGIDSKTPKKIIKNEKASALYREGQEFKPYNIEKLLDVLLGDIEDKEPRHKVIAIIKERLLIQLGLREKE